MIDLRYVRRILPSEVYGPNYARREKLVLQWRRQYTREVNGAGEVSFSEWVDVRTEDEEKL